MESNGDSPHSGSPPKRGNIESQKGSIRWDREAISDSLQGLFDYVIGEAHRTEDWYWSKKRRKALGSQVIHWSALVLAGLAGLLPIGARVLPALGGWATATFGMVDTGLLTTFGLGLSASLVAFNRATGLSSGWTRYVLTATAVRSATEEFKMDWAALTSTLENPPAREQVSMLLQRAKTFRMTVEGFVTKETQEWATEFKNALAQLEKDVQSRLDTARAERQKADDEMKAQAEQRAAELKKAATPGSVEATITNAVVADGFKFEASLATNEGDLFKEEVSSSDSWTRLAVPSGDYKLVVTASIKTKKVSKAAVVSVKSGETTKVALTLPAPP